MRCMLMALASASLAISISAAALGIETPQPHYGAWGLDLKAMDAAEKPGDDFYIFSNGNWLKAAEIPPDRSVVGAVFDLSIQAEQRITEIIAALEASPYTQLSDEEKKIRDLYAAFVDRKEIDARGLSSVQVDLDRFAHLNSWKDVASVMGSPQLMTGDAVDLMHSGLFDMKIGIDEKNPFAYALYISQSSLGMPDRDYYLGHDKTLAAARSAYKKYLTRMLELAGAPDSADRAAAVFALETRIATAQWPNSDRRDKTKTYNPMSVAELEAFAPGFQWKAYLAAAGLPTDSRVIVVEKSAIQRLAAISAQTPVGVWRDLLELHYFHAHAEFLPTPFDDADFSFYGRVIRGNGRQLDRAARGGQFVNHFLGDALGKLYVSRYFPPAAKVKAEGLVDNLRKAYEADIRTLRWMSAETRHKALEKLQKLTVHVGYPEHWRDYAGLHIARHDLVGNVHRTVYFEWQRQLARLGKSVDRSEWSLTPQTVNAHNTAELNAIFFPAAVLQPPIFDPNADEAVNYGAIGAVIGHEMSHSFDDQGSQFNGDGALEDWWTKADRLMFDEKTAALEKQFDGYEPLPGVHVNGKVTLGENIADLAGLAIAVEAYHISLGGKTPQVLGGFSDDQRLFLSFAQLWRLKFRDSALREQLLSDDHSPPQFRVDGSMRNLDAWYTAFNVKSGDKYYLAPELRVQLW